MTVLTLQRGHYGNMRRHYKLKHPYIFHTETEKSKKAWKKRKAETSQVETEKDKTEENEEDSNVEAKVPKSILTQLPKKRRSALWQHFVDLETGFVRCKECNLKLRDRHYIAVLHLNRRHPNAFAELGDFNIMPFTQRNNLLWNFFMDEGNKLVRCLLCGITMHKNMSKHLQLKHADDFKQAMSRKREELIKYCEPRPPRPFRTWVKKYCTKIADKQYRCNECGILLRLPNGLYGNMRRHIRNKHPNIYQKETKTGKSGKINTAMKENWVDLLDIDSNSDALNLKDPLADFDLGSPALSETEIATNFLKGDNLASNLCSEIDLDAINDLPVLEPSHESGNYDKSYFLLVDDCKYKCIQCEATVNCPNIEEQEALFTHIRDKHPEEVMTLQATSTENDDEYQVVVLGNLDT